MRSFLPLFLFACIAYQQPADAQRLRVSDNQRFLVTEEGEPFFWLADTAWELFHRLNREEATYYLETRAAQGFNVIQAVILAELDGLNTPNAYGAIPLVAGRPDQPEEAYFNHVDFVLDRADSLGLYMAVLPSWGDKVYKDRWGTGPEIFTPENAFVYGAWLGKRYGKRDNIIWILGGDRNPREGTDDVRIWREMARGIASTAGGPENTLMSFHPQPRDPGGSSHWFHADPWLDFNMHQTGHCPDKLTFKIIAHDYALTPVKPVIDAEPLYEDHPNCFNAGELGYSLPRDIRRIMYWNVFSGAFGQTYGCHDVWQMYAPGRDPVNGPLRPWKAALQLPMANQAKHLKNLMLSRPFLSRLPDNSLIRDPQDEDLQFVVATRDAERTYALVYFPEGTKTTLDLTAFEPRIEKAWWFDPRTGNTFPAKATPPPSLTEIEPPTSGPGNDWVLVIDRLPYPPPGKRSSRK